MRLTASPPWVAGSASNAKTASWHSLSFIRLALACCGIVGLGVAMLLSGVEPFQGGEGGNRSPCYAVGHGPCAGSRRPVMTQLPHVLNDAAGHIDVELWRKHREHCGVRRFWDGDDDEFGRLVHKPGGAEHARWVFDYDETAEDDDEAGYRFGNHAFRNGEYVSIRGDDGRMHTFQVASVEPAT